MLALNVELVAHGGVPLYVLWFLSFKCVGALRVLNVVLDFGDVFSYGGLDIFGANLIDFFTQSLRAWVIVLFSLLGFFRVDWKELTIEAMPPRPICVFMNGTLQALKRLLKLLRSIESSVYDSLKFFR